MADRFLTTVAVPTALLLLFVALFAGQLLGQPVLLAYVETGSMAPTLEPGDGFVAIPMVIAGPVEPGDVITFNAEVLHGGGLVTHRVIAETPEGYITQGDANPVADQDGSEPPVSESQIKAKALQIGDTLVAIPKIGLVVIGVNGAIGAVAGAFASATGTTVAGGSQTISYALFGIGVTSYVVFSYAERNSTPRKTGRETARSVDSFNAGVLSLVLTMVLLAMLTGTMVIPSGQQEFSFVSADTDAEGPSVIQRGTAETVTYFVPSNGPIPIVAYLTPATEGIDVQPREFHVRGGRRENATVVLQAPPERGPVTRTLVEHRYLAIVPPSTIKALYQIHPWLPIVYIDSIIGVGFEALAFVLIGTGQKRVRSRSTSRS